MEGALNALMKGLQFFEHKFQNLLLFSAAGMKTSQWKIMRVLIADDQKAWGHPWRNGRPLSPPGR